MNDIEKVINIAARIFVMNMHANDTAYFQSRSIEDFTEGAKWAMKMVGKDKSISEDRLNPIHLSYEILEINGWKKDIDGWYQFPTRRSNLYIKRSSVNNDDFLLCVSEDKHNIASITYIHELQYLMDSLGYKSKLIIR